MQSDLAAFVAHEPAFVQVSGALLGSAALTAAIDGFLRAECVQRLGGDVHRYSVDAEVGAGVRPKPKVAAGPTAAPRPKIGLDLAKWVPELAAEGEAANPGLPQLQKGQSLELEAWMTTVKISTCKDCTRADLLKSLEEVGLGSSCDFVYLPMNYKTGKNYGFAVVNFVDSESVRRASSVFSRQHEEDAEGFKVSGFYCQGLAALIDKYSVSAVVRESDDSLKPMFIYSQQWHVLQPSLTGAGYQPAAKRSRRQRARCAARAHAVSK